MKKIIQHMRDHGPKVTMHRTFRKFSEATTKLWHVGKGTSLCRSYYGILMEPHWGDKTFEMCIFGSYGTFYSDYLKNVHQKFYFIDVGANQGVYSLIASRMDMCEGGIAFEPVPNTYDILKRNIQFNNSDSIKAVDAAISNSTGESEINLNSDHSGAASLENHYSTNSNKKLKIRLISAQELENLVNELDSKSINLVIKIDVEGHEMVVLKELVKCDFFERVISIFYEVNEEWHNHSVIETLLRKHGFEHFQRVINGKPCNDTTVLTRHYDILAMRRDNYLSEQR